MASAKKSTAMATAELTRRVVKSSGRVAGSTTWRHSSQRLAPSDLTESRVACGMALAASRMTTTTWKKTVRLMSAILGASARPSSTSKMGSNTILGSG